MRIRARAGLPVLALLLATACGGPAAVRPVEAAASCEQLPEAVLPHTVGSLTEAESGRYCLPVGEQVSVFLTAGPGRWSAVTSSDPKVAQPVGTNMLTAPMGVTPGMFRAAAAGTVQLSSRDGQERAWQVTLVVR